MVRFNKLPKKTLLDLISEYSKYVQNSIENRSLPVGVESFYMDEYRDILKNRKLEEAQANEPMNAEDTEKMYDLMAENDESEDMER